MKETVSESVNLFLVEYTGIIDEIELNWGFQDRYFEEERIPVLFIFSNFPHTISTNRQSLMGIIRTHVEERKGIIFFPTQMEEEMKHFVREALLKEKVELDFHIYSDEKYNLENLAQICDTCFSIKNIKLKEVIMMVEPTKQLAKYIHRDMIERLKPMGDRSEYGNEDVICFIMDKNEKSIIEALNLGRKPSLKWEISFEALVKDRAFKTRFFDLFSGENSAPDRIKRFYLGKDWKFQSLLILYSGKHKRVFIQDLPVSAFFLNANETTFMGLNTEYSLISYSYKSDPDQKITMTKNKITDKFDILVDDKPIDRADLKHDIMVTFPGCTTSVNQLLQMITHTQSNEYRFFYDKMAIVVKIFGNKYLIESYEAK